MVRLCPVGKGQSILANQADIPSIRNDIEGKNDIDGMTKMLGNALKPIPVDETLLEYLEPKNVWNLSNNGVPPPQNNTCQEAHHRMRRLFAPGMPGFQHPSGLYPRLTKGISYECNTQKVAGATARHRGSDNGISDLYPAVIYRGAELSFRSVFCPQQRIQPRGL